jgi:hypothetical protein
VKTEAAYTSKTPATSVHMMYRPKNKSRFYSISMFTGLDLYAPRIQQDFLSAFHNVKKM